MERESKSFTKPDRIDIERFFQAISGKIGKRSMDAVTAAMVESVSKAGVCRVLKLSPSDPIQLSKLLSELRGKRDSFKPV